jgi:tRNA-specific 2-thiouridylase
MLGQAQLSRTLLPVGRLTKQEVRDIAAGMSLRTASKPDSQDVCFISRTAGRERFLGARIQLREATLVDRHGAVVGSLPGFELLTVGQRRGLGHVRTEGGARAYVVDRDHRAATVTVGPLEDLLVGEIALGRVAWVDGPPAAGEALDVQMSAHGTPVPGEWDPAGRVVLGAPVRRVSPGQSVVLYRGETVVGGGTAL